MQPVTRATYMARLADCAADVAGAQALRHLAFRGRPGLDADRFDALCRHLLIEDKAGALVACCRVQDFADGADLADSYAAQTYDLCRMARIGGPKMELGRFCLHPGRHDPDILRLIWGALTQLIDRAGVGLLFGCTSLPGADPALHRKALAALRRYVAPADQAPGPRAPERVALPDDGRRDLSGLPPLLRSYLAMGAWVSDHAVIDRDMDTLHVLTGLATAQVPIARARTLRALASGESNASG